jgi:hypothetical protein
LTVSATNWGTGVADADGLQQLERAWFGPRLVAIFIDSLIFGVVWMIVGFSALVSFIPPNIEAMPPPAGEVPPEIVSLMANMMWLILAMQLLIFTYFVLLEAWSGATIGKKLVGIGTVQLSNPARRGLPVGTALWREFVKIVGFLPPLLLMAYGAMLIPELADARSLDVHEGWFVITQLLQFLPLIWLAWIGISLVNHNDPVYDRAAGTAVVRTR